MTAHEGHVVVRCLCKELGADVNKATNDGATPLFEAAQTDHLDVVRCLCKDIEADVKQGRNDGETAVYLAA